MVLKSIYKEEGWRSFYRGLAAPLGALVVLNSMNFTLYAKFRRLLDKQYVSGDTTKNGFDYRVLCAGGFVGPFAGLVSTPFEFLKIQMQFNRIQCDNQAKLNQNHIVRFRNTFHAFRHIIQYHGVRPLFTGHTVNTLREVVFLTTYFGCYEHSKTFFMSLLPSSISIPFAGGMSGAIGWLLSYPLDCVKGNIQNVNLLELKNNGIQQTGNNNASILTTARYIISKNGFFGLYSGVSISLLRAFLISATRFSCYESVMWILTRKSH